MIFHYSKIIQQVENNICLTIRETTFHNFNNVLDTLSYGSIRISDSELIQQLFFV